MNTVSLIALNFLLLLPVIFSKSLQLKRSDNDVSEGLVLLHVIHRHGDRTPDAITYPNDPNKKSTCLPYGAGQLTIDGKARMLQVGKDLRRRYNKFLGEYYSDSIHARTTDFDRTKMSIQLSTAGLFPPSREALMDPFLAWQPIPYTYEPWRKDYILGIANVFCPKYDSLSREYVEKLNLTDFDQALYKYISKSTGYNWYDTIMKTTIIYHALKTQEECGYDPPAWILCLWEKKLKKLAITNFARLTATKELARLSGGFFIKKMIQDTISKINGSLVPEGRKIFLYSAHDYNIAVILGALGVFPNKLPNYGSHIMIEVRKINGKYGIQVLFENNEGKPNPELLTIPGCKPFCPLNDFIKITRDIIPDNLYECKIHTDFWPVR